MIKKTLSLILLNLLIFSFSVSSVTTVWAKDLGNWNLLKNSNSCTLANLDGVTGLVIHSKGKGATLLNSEWELKNRYSKLKFVFDKKVHRTVAMQVKENRVNFSLDRPNDLKTLLHKHKSLSIKSKSGKPIANYGLDGFQDGYKEFLKCNGLNNNLLKENIASTTTSNSYSSNSK